MLYSSDSQARSLSKEEDQFKKLNCTSYLNTPSLWFFYSWAFRMRVLTDSLIHKNKDDIIITVHRKGFYFSCGTNPLRWETPAFPMINTYDLKIRFKNVGTNLEVISLQ